MVVVSPGVVVASRIKEGLDPLFLPTDGKTKIIEDAKLEFDNLISSGTDDLESTDEIFN